MTKSMRYVELVDGDKDKAITIADFVEGDLHPVPQIGSEVAIIQRTDIMQKYDRYKATKVRYEHNWLVDGENKDEIVVKHLTIIIYCIKLP